MSIRNGQRRNNTHLTVYSSWRLADRKKQENRELTSRFRLPKRLIGWFPVVVSPDFEGALLLEHKYPGRKYSPPRQKLGDPGCKGFNPATSFCVKFRQLADFDALK